MQNLVFILNNEVRARIKSLRKYAEAHPFDHDAMKAITAGKRPAPGDRLEFRVLVPTQIPHLHFKAVATVEIHPKKDGTGSVWMYHWSFSSPRPGYFMRPEAVDLILEEFEPGMSHKQAIVVDEETIGPGHKALSLWFLHPKSKHEAENLKKD